jgi:hypothetical protein
VAQGGKGVVVSGCPRCKKGINTMGQFLDHLTNDVMPELIDRLATMNRSLEHGRGSPTTRRRTTACFSGGHPEVHLWQYRACRAAGTTMSAQSQHALS